VGGVMFDAGFWKVCIYFIVDEKKDMMRRKFMIGRRMTPNLASSCFTAGFLIDQEKHTNAGSVFLDIASCMCVDFYAHYH